MTLKTKRSVPIAMALCMLGNGISAQEDVVSPGGVLVERQLLDESLTAREAPRGLRAAGTGMAAPYLLDAPRPGRNDHRRRSRSSGRSQGDLPLAGSVRLARAGTQDEPRQHRARLVSGSDPKKPRAPGSGLTGRRLRPSTSRTTRTPDSHTRRYGDIADLRDRTGTLEGSLHTFMNARRNPNAA